MRVPSARPDDPFHFSYCLNVHPGETLADARHAIATYPPLLRDALGAPFGLGLRLAAAAARELQDPAALAAFRHELASAGLYAFTVNAFPHGAFHRTRVKERVYQPDWREPARFDYTARVFDALAGLLPDGVDGSVSTVPLSYATWPRDAAARADMRRQLTGIAARLARLEAERGLLLHLGLEPEPDCTLETTPQTLAYFEEEIFRVGRDELAAREHIPAATAEAWLRRHLGVCFDTCHVALQYESPAASLRAYAAAGVRVSKVQVSAALEADPDVSPGLLRAFDDGVYLHQAKTRDAQGRVGGARDLPAWLAAPDPAARELRIHVHVPLHWPGADGLRSTRHTLDADFWKALQASDCRHVEVETYTFDVLPAAVRDGGLAQNLLRECQWALAGLRTKKDPSS
jgi:sugar phosphate isomerase/epimerase